MSRSTANIGSKFRTGLAATGAVNIGRQIVEFVSGIILARLLVPEDFGIVAIGMGFLRISFVVGNLGMGAAVIQAESVDRKDLDTASSISALIGIGLSAAGILLSPVAADFFSMPALETAMPVMSLQVLLAGLGAIPIATMRRDLLYGRIALIEGASSLIYAVVGIGLAATGWGVWSLVWAPLAGGVWTAVAAVATSGYLPKPGLDRTAVRKFMRFGGGLTIKNTFYFASRNMDYLIVARMLGAASTGLYTRAFKLTRLPQDRLVGVLYSMSFPVFCRLRDDTTRFHEWFEKVSVVIAVASTPLVLGLSAVADDFILGILGSQWEGAIVPLRILGFAAAINCQHALVGAAIDATGKIRYEIATQFIYAVLVVTGCIVGAGWGLGGVGFGILIAALTMYAMKAYTMYVATGLPVSRYLRPAFAPMVAGLTMYAAVRWGVSAIEIGDGTESGPRLVRLLASTTLGAVVYGATLYMLSPASIHTVWDQLKKLRGDVSNRAARSETVEESAEAP
jgi:PST family polysaccharide transporter